MSLIAPDSLKAIAESVGIADFSDDAAKLLAPDVEYRLREIAQEAIKFMKHSKRSKLTTEDVSNALRLRNVEQLYGFTSKEPLQFGRVGSSSIYFVKDEELPLNYVVEQMPLPKCPIETTLSLHWLAIEGVQPAIPQNVSTKEEPTAASTPATASASTSTARSKKRRTSTATTTTSTTAAANSNVEVKPMVKHVLSKELQLYYEKIATTIKGGDQALVQAALSSLKNDTGLHQLLPYFGKFVQEEVTHNLRKLTLLKNLMLMVGALLDSPHLHIEPYLHQLLPSILTCLVGRRLCENPSENHWELRHLAADMIAKICSKYSDSYSNLQRRVTQTLVQAFLDPTKPLTTHYGAIIGLAGLGIHVIELLVLPNLAAYMKLLQPELDTHNPNKQKQLEAQKCYQALLNVAGTYVHHLSTGLALPSQQQIKAEPSTHKGDSTDAMATEPTTDSSSNNNNSKNNNNLTVADVQTMFSNGNNFYQELFDIFGESLIPFVSKTPSALASAAATTATRRSDGDAMDTEQQPQQREHARGREDLSSAIFI